MRVLALSFSASAEHARGRDDEVRSIEPDKLPRPILPKPHVDIGQLLQEPGLPCGFAAGESIQVADDDDVELSATRHRAQGLQSRSPEDLSARDFADDVALFQSPTAVIARRANSTWRGTDSTPVPPLSSTLERRA